MIHLLVSYEWCLYIVALSLIIITDAQTCWLISFSVNNANFSESKPSISLAVLRIIDS